MDRHEIIEELKYITSHEGFVLTCLELKEGMLFYDRNVLLAAYAGEIERMLIGALFTASLESSATLEATIEELQDIIALMPRRLVRRQSPVDIQYLVDSFLESRGWILQERLPVLNETFRHYVAGNYRLEDNIDGMLRRVGQLLRTGKEGQARRLCGQIGALVLRGRPFRQCWYLIAEPRLALWINALENIQANLYAHPFEKLPLGTIEEERAGWRATFDEKVIDLNAYRRYHDHDLEGNLFMEEVPAEEDDVDRLMHDLLMKDMQALPPGTMTSIRRHRKQVVPLLLAILENESLCRKELEEGERGPAYFAIQILGKLRIKSAIPLLTKLLAGITRPGIHFVEMVVALERVADSAKKYLLPLVGQSQNSLLNMAIADILEHASLGEDVFRALVDLFDQAQGTGEKNILVNALVNYGDPRAISVLRAQKGYEPELKQRIEKAIAHLQNS